ncbi:hypothetical protein B0H21DRAFT_248328 [Amylocystis lapponica]|nr:hypothetical protein B0H21DRAFT_248328 [Amylocystis lapponica]
MVVTSHNATVIDPTRASPSVTISTITGIIVGAICLFGLIISYRLLSTRWALSSTRGRHSTVLSPVSGVAAPPQWRWNDLWARCATVMKSLCLWPHSPLVNMKTSPISQKRTRLHSFILPFSYGGNREPMRWKSTAHFRTHSRPSSPADVYSPVPPRREYKELNNGKYSGRSEGARVTEKPPTAVMSPWSLSEDQYPYPAIPTPLARIWQGADHIPPPFTPPPAYVPKTPLRGRFLSSQSTIPPSPTGRSPLQAICRVSPPKQQPAGDIDLTGVVAVRRDSARGVFVVGDEMDNIDSDSASLWSTFSQISL